VKQEAGAVSVRVHGNGSAGVKPTKTMPGKAGGDLVLQEIWRIKDEQSAARGHDVHRLFAEARKRQKHSGHPVVNLQAKRRKT